MTARPFRLLACFSLLTVGCGTRREAATTPPPVTNAPAPANAPENGGAPTVAAGAALYQQHCQSCHGARGEGVKNAGVALIEESGEEEAELRGVIRRGKGKMPAFKDQLTEEQITAVIQHLRTFQRAGAAGEYDEHDRNERREQGERR